MPENMVPLYLYFLKINHWKYSQLEECNSTLLKSDIIHTMIKLRKAWYIGLTPCTTVVGLMV